MHVAAGAEIAARTAQHHHLDGLGINKRAKHVAQLGIGFEGQRVLAFRVG
jgi:hypothetical protein